MLEINVPFCAQWIFPIEERHSKCCGLSSPASSKFPPQDVPVEGSKVQVRYVYILNSISSAFIFAKHHIYFPSVIMLSRIVKHLNNRINMYINTLTYLLSNLLHYEKMQLELTPAA